MEKYQIHQSAVTIEYKAFEEKIYAKHQKSYGDESANKIRDTTTNILAKSIEQKEDANLSNNVLLVGKVQSGKTSNLEMLTALAFDNGFNLLILYGGYDNSLLKQSFDRFSETFDVEIDEDESPLIFSTEIKDFSFLNNQFVINAKEANRPIIIAALKRPPALQKINDCLSKLNQDLIKALIIDDEGDQASLNTLIFKEDASSTYSEICRMKKILRDPIYYSVTATPQANIFQPDLSALKPDNIFLIYPGNAYTGADVFHLQEDRVIEIDDENESLIQGKYVKSLKNAVDYFIVATAINEIKGRKRSDMIIHAFREVAEHERLYKIIKGEIDNINDCITYNDPDLIRIFRDFQHVYNQFVDSEIKKEVPWDEKLESTIKKLLQGNIFVLQQNSASSVDEKVLRLFKHRIYIGGDLLQRGITFKNLIVTYFTRWANQGNMDTSLQRARWFGYRYEYLPSCKLFTTKTIRDEFSNLASIENDLWDQFAQVENNQLSINDIIIDAEDTSLNPTRGNVASFAKSSFRKKWNSQRYITQDINQVTVNNNEFNKLLSAHTFETTSSGRTDNKVSAYYSMISGDEFCSFVDKTEYIFEQNPFNKKNIKELLLGKPICLELMYDYENRNLLKSVRERSVTDWKISALQQGADDVDFSKQTYRGDSFVIVDNSVICIQVYLIQPKNYDSNLKQYMYSIHFPKERTVFYKK